MAIKKITEEILSLAYKMARGGINDKSIYESLQISKALFYKNKNLIDTIKKARADLRQEVSSSLLEKANNEKDTTALIFLAKRLNLFCSETNISLKCPQSALESLNLIVNDTSISLEHKNSLRGFINDYLKAYEITELEIRLQELEQRIKNGK